MVTINPNEVPAGSSVATTHRGFVPAGEVVVPTTAQSPGLAWGGIIAGALSTLGILALSAALAYACEVSSNHTANGVAGTGAMGFGWGAAVWAWITAIIAFYVGGMVASVAARGRYLVSGMLQGFIAWALVLALGLAFSGASVGFQFAGTSLRYNLVTPGTGEMAGGLTLAAWSAFICLALGLIFSLIGGSTGCAKMSTRTP